MKPPIIAENRGDLLIFGSLEKAESYLEAIDVRNDEYVVYDSEGRLLRAAADSDFGPVRIAEAENAPTHQEQLRRALISYLRAVSSRESDLRHDLLDTLVTRALKYRTG